MLVAYAAVVWFWGDPITALYAEHEQHQLSQSFDREVHAWPTAPVGPDTTTGIAHIRADAHRFQAGLKGGHPFGRLQIPRLGLSVIVVQGTDWLSDLSKGPGHYTQTSVPGLGRTVAIAGIARRSARGSGTSTRSGTATRSASRRRTGRSATGCSTTGS